MALKRLVLRDFVIVHELEVDLASGFTVLTGETGAGKSILIEALQLVTGARADASVIREGAARTDVSAEFDVSAHLEVLLLEYGFLGGETLLLRRTVDTQGKSRAWVNGSPATAQQLRVLGEHLLDIHGQHAWQSLTRADAVRGLLDAYAQVSTASLCACWSHWRQTEAAFSKAQASQDEAQRERERLSWQIGELEKLNPLADEWDTLNQQHSRLANGQSLIDAASEAVAQLDGNDSNALQQLNRALAQLQQHVRIEAAFQGPLDEIASSIAQIEDAAYTLRSYARHSELEPERLTELDARITQWMYLARRYKRLPQELPSVLTTWKQELSALDAAVDLAGLQAAQSKALAEFMHEAKAVSQKRMQAAGLLAAAVTRTMQGLGMQGGEFQVKLQPLAQPTQGGLEDVQFLVAGHAGSTPKPVGKVASGGALTYSVGDCSNHQSTWYCWNLDIR